jgi:hypothetical protein
VSASEQSSDSRPSLHAPRAYVVQVAADEHCGLQESPPLLHHLRSHWSCCSPRGFVFATVVARARLEVTILVVVVDQRRGVHYSLALQARWVVLSRIQSACGGGRKERRGTRIDQTTFFFTIQGSGRGCNSNGKRGPKRRSRQVLRR